MGGTRVLWTLFWRMFVISAFVLGGGFAIIAVADEVFSKKLRWTEEGEILGQLPVFQMVPGMICTNTAIYIGSKMAGPLGAAVALAGTVLPSIVIFLSVTVLYDTIPVDSPCLCAAFIGLRASLTGIIAALVVMGWARNVRGVYGYLAVAASSVLLVWFRISAPLVIAAAAAIGIGIESGRGIAAARRRGKIVVPSVCWALPLLFLKYGSLSFGGGYVLVPMYMEDFVGSAAPYLQIGAEEFANVMAMTQMTPGSISVNCATFFGYRMCGVVGSVVATVGLVLPNYVLLLLLLRSFERFRGSTVVRGLLSGIRPVTVSLMLAASWTFAGMSLWTAAEGGLHVDVAAVAIFAVTVVALLTRRMSVVQLVFGSAVVSALLRFVMG